MPAQFLRKNIAYSHFNTLKQMRVSIDIACQLLITLQCSYTFPTQYSTINFYAK